MAQSLKNEYESSNNQKESNIQSCKNYVSLSNYGDHELDKMHILWRVDGQNIFYVSPVKNINQDGLHGCHHLQPIFISTLGEQISVLKINMKISTIWNSTFPPGYISGDIGQFIMEDDGKCLTLYLKKNDSGNISRIPINRNDLESRGTMCT